MPGIPGQFDRDLSDLSAKHSTIATKIQILHYAGLRTTTNGDAKVNADHLIGKTRQQIEDVLTDYIAAVRALAANP
jgi:accessory colonization factor AcfC